MLAKLHQPGGALGTLSVIATLFLGIVGVVGIVSTLIPAWDDDLDMSQSDEVLLGVLCAFMLVGAIGFVIMDRQAWLGAALAILGSVALAISVFWTIVPVVLGVVFAVVAVQRGRTLHRRSAQTSHRVA